MRNYTGPWLVVIAAITVLCMYMIWPDNPGLFGRPIVVRPGLDVQGGVRVLMRGEGTDVNAEKMDEVRRVISRRVNSLGVSEPIIQVAGTNRIIVELPGIQNPEQAVEIIQETALLEFVNFSRVGSCTASMPVAGQYILTNRQLQRNFEVTPDETDVTPEATAEGTSNPELTPASTAEATPGATPETTGDATPDAAATPEASPEATVQPFFRPGLRAQTPEATGDPTPEPTPDVAPDVVPGSTPDSTPEATPAATTEAAPAPTADATAEATPAATPEAVAPATTPETDVIGSRGNPLLNPCTNQPFETVMTGAALTDAQARIGGQAQNQWVVSFQVNTGNSEGQNLATFTGANVGQPMAIVLDGEVLSAPTIQDALTDGGEISGSFTQESARALALQLRSGALPVSLAIESREQVGATLGAESVAAAVRAGILGILTIFVFLLAYYRTAGVAAGLALLVFMVVNFALYKFIPVTLTLSAITGFLIAIGSAIDGNILVFERIKEELRAGRNQNKAIELGYSRAWVTIRDSNISTIMIGLILYFFGGQFGASAVQGFAVTLILGLTINLFTAVIVTRVFLMTIINLLGQRAQRVSMFGQ